MDIKSDTLGRSLGTGTVGASFLATDGNGNPVVVRRLDLPPGAPAEALASFLGATGLTAKITNSKFLAKVLIQRRDAAGTVLFREHVPGKSLAQIEAEGGLAGLDAGKLARELCEALRALHQKKIVHGGIHPGNIFVGTDGRLKLTDYGIGRAMLLGADADYPLPALRYLAPEVIGGQPPGTAADVYAAGLVAYLLAERKHLIEGATGPQIRARILKGPGALGGPLSALSLRPDQRPATAEKLFAELKTWVAQRGPGAEHAPQRTFGPSWSLRSLYDQRGKQELLALDNGQPWRLRRTGEAQEWPIILTNGGPDELVVRVRCTGDGLRVAPGDRLRISPGASESVVLKLDAGGGGFARLDIDVENGTAADRIRLRLHRPF